MRRITRNERIRDIKPERERGPVVFKLPPRGDAEHDPMFPRPTGVVGAAWVGGLDPLPASPTPATPEPPLELPPSLPEQHNDHVMTYWTWRLDRLEAKRNG